MSAYNWIIIESDCPACGHAATIRCQTHVASSFGGDDTGRFHNRRYRLGDQMAWWPESDPRFPEWCEDSEPHQPPDQAVEACYARCERCREDLYVIVRFVNLRLSEILGIGRESHWPAGYHR